MPGSGMSRGVPRRGRRLVMVSTYPPRRCGLATFTQDLRTALGEVVPDWRVEVAAMDRGHLHYDPEVVARVEQHDPRAYQRVGRMIVGAGVDLVVIQHEYGIFGGHAGVYVLELTRALHHHRVPYVVTLHTVLSTPSAGQTAVLYGLCRDAARVTVFTPGARRVLAATGLIDAARVSVVPHGAPVALRTPQRLPARTAALGAALPPAAGSPLLSTFGLIGPGKGLEQVISALPGIVARHPRVRYVIAGATHPEVLRHTGEAYRQHLATLADRLHVGEHVRFVDAFLTEADLAALLTRTTIYLTPYRRFEQSCSGTLAFALVAGCPVISTPYRYAVEMLTPPGVAPAGILVAPDDPAALATIVGDLLDDPAALAAMRSAARSLGAHLVWPVVATSYARVYAAALAPVGGPASATTVAPVPGPRAPSGRSLRAPAPSRTAPEATPALRVRPRRRGEGRLDHLDTLVDATGMIQFARGACPDPTSGYCVDDAARLAIVAAALYDPNDPRPRRWLRTALRLLNTAAAPGGMHNLMSPDGRWCDAPHLGDHVGRTVWAAGVVAGTPDPIGVPHRAIARHLLHILIPLLGDLPAPRSIAYAVLGLTQVTGRASRAAACAAAQRLDTSIDEQAGWCWFEPDLTYDNARLPQALLAAGIRLQDATFTTHALSTLDWYLEQVGLTGAAPMLRCVGNRWRAHDATPGEEGDEQPLDAAATVEALAAAWQATGQPRYARLAQVAFGWFTGHNRAGIAVYDPETGGCHDGLSAHTVNANQGAESTLAYHQALAALCREGLAPPPADRPHPGDQHPSDRQTQQTVNDAAQRPPTFPVHLPGPPAVPDRKW